MSHKSKNVDKLSFRFDKNGLIFVFVKVEQAHQFLKRSDVVYQKLSELFRACPNLQLVKVGTFFETQCSMVLSLIPQVIGGVRKGIQPKLHPCTRSLTVYVDTTSS